VTKTIERIEVLNLVLVGIGAVIGWITGIIHVPSFVLGGGVMQANFWLLKKVVRCALAPVDSRRKIHAALWLTVKGGFYLFLLSAVFIRYPIDAKSFVAGVPLLLIACMIIGLSKSKGRHSFTSLISPRD
jgi:hypothetical protein